MPDMLVKLWALPNAAQFKSVQSDIGRIVVRRAMAYERRQIAAWVERAFNPQWADESIQAFGHHPIACFIALDNDRLCGFSCFDCTFRGFFGPAGVRKDMRAMGIGARLLLETLQAMYARGYAYAVIGDAGAPDFFRKVAGAVDIDDSSPGPYPRKIT
ncbi:MAG: GNAT family N-acetyltransferase [Desulfobacteraceae bacterium]|nr:GNAT family N-acetyltransferase [Desulfobacteraceae bacterium]